MESYPGGPGSRDVGSVLFSKSFMQCKKITGDNMMTLEDKVHGTCTRSAYPCVSSLNTGRTPHEVSYIKLDRQSWRDQMSLFLYSNCFTVIEPESGIFAMNH